jgi:hypothetical protein
VSFSNGLPAAFERRPRGRGKAGRRLQAHSFDDVPVGNGMRHEGAFGGAVSGDERGARQESERRPFR